MPLIFPTENTTQGTALAPTGICNGMTAAWASVSIPNNGCNADHRRQVEAGGLLLATRVRLARTGVLSADAGEQWTAMIAASGLKSTHRTSTAFGGGIALAAELLKYGNATAYIVITFAGGGHAVGARVSDTSCDFFDPNVGLMRDDSAVAFSAAMADRMSGYHGWMNNPTHIWTLEA